MKTMVIGVTWTCTLVLALSIYMYGGASAEGLRIRAPKFPLAMKLDTFLSECSQDKDDWFPFSGNGHETNKKSVMSQWPFSFRTQEQSSCKFQNMVSNERETLMQSVCKHDLSHKCSFINDTRNLSKNNKRAISSHGFVTSLQIATGRIYEELYFIVDANDLAVGPLQAFTTTLTAESSSLVNPRVTRRIDGRIPGGPCITATAQLQLVVQRSPCKRATFDMTSGTGSDVNRIFYFTTKPDEYLAEFMCLQFENNDCKEGFFVNLYTVRAPPNQFDWKRAVKDIRRQVGLDFTDPRSVYAFRTADACPEP